MCKVSRNLLDEHHALGYQSLFLLVLEGGIL
jgi:hypothetical protein